MASGYETVNVVIAVDADGDALIVGMSGMANSYLLDVLNGHFACDNEFSGLPTEPGLYNCKAEPRWAGGWEDDSEGEMEFHIVSAEKVASIADGIATIEIGAGKAQLVETVDAMSKEMERVKRERDEARALIQKAARALEWPEEFSEEFVALLPPNRQATATMRLVSRGRGKLLPLDDFEPEGDTLEWSSEPPTEPGYYYWRSERPGLQGPPHMIVEVYKSINDELSVLFHGSEEEGSIYEGEWAKVPGGG